MARKSTQPVEKPVAVVEARAAIEVAAEKLEQHGGERAINIALRLRELLPQVDKIEESK